MRRFISQGRDLVNVEIEGELRRYDQPLNSGLFASFALGDEQYVFLAVAMSSELQPAIEFPMVMQQSLSAVGADHERAAGEMSGKRVAAETIGAGIEKPYHLLTMRQFWLSLGKVERQ
jgi:hypothetical protein